MPRTSPLPRQGMWKWEWVPIKIINTCVPSQKKKRNSVIGLRGREPTSRNSLFRCRSTLNRQLHSVPISAAEEICGLALMSVFSLPTGWSISEPVSSISAIFKPCSFNKSGKSTIAKNFSLCCPLEVALELLNRSF